MIIQDKLKAVQLPQIYEREGKNCYYDTFRRKLIEITPEETVRQKVVAYFISFCGVPKDLMWLEVPISYYSKGVSGRADIIIHGIDDDQILYPLVVIECKNETVLLTDRVVEQAARYCDHIGGKYIIVTNGIEIKMAVYQKKSNTYVYLDELLTYKEMIGEEYKIPKLEEWEFKRFTVQEMADQQIIEQYNDEGSWIFGSGTVTRLKSFVVNLYQCLLDVEHRLPIIKNYGFELLQDIGQTYMDYTNAGGGHYDGIYRAFLVKDRHGEAQIVSISLFGTDANFRGENRNSYTSLVVSIDRFKTSHNSLQYNIDRFTRIEGNKIKFCHNGQIGNIKNAEVINIVKKYGRGLSVNDNSIELGELEIDKLLYLDDIVVAEFIYKLIEYALLREELRREKKKV